MNIEQIMNTNPHNCYERRGHCSLEQTKELLQEIERGNYTHPMRLLACLDGEFWGYIESVSEIKPKTERFFQGRDIVIVYPNEPDEPDVSDVKITFRATSDALILLYQETAS